ncbi:N-alpha-acetyl-L-2,4-diaminobutyric acid deacetylase [Aquicella siphonis]|uniref:N-alpha-acetyl-L-2,4-diaminobutyric acid deacetylase n=1 Tax=Aquicella siphonis TaxID=254247 RepID=A0A5E4PIT5_9COXI|nr:succinylglutamate desuccinylase/aspartoacylase family protein [Aquicella siphonis]VVC76323.1 N-alpha-acetyl-L-2,4-diaminobutyric acid deacetylase [Aquicella siphonis]
MKNKTLIIAGNTIKPGERKVILFPAPNINTQIKIDIPVHIFHGKRAGPKLFIVSAIHGDELNSIEIIRRVHEYIHKQELKGTLITVPVVNIHGVIMQTRYLSDRRDLNRSFPGSKKGTLAGRLAHALIQHVMSNCNYGIDLHTGAVGRMNMPQLRVDFSTPGSKDFARSFNAPVILDSKQRDGSLRQAASELGIPLIVYEGGEALRFNELCIRAGVRGIVSVMHHLKMVKSGDRHAGKKSKSVITKTSRWVRAPASGLIEPVKDAFARSVKQGEILARIHDPFLMNPSTPVIAPFDGIVIGQSLKAMTTEGDALYHIASFKKITGVRAYIEELREEISNP